MKRPRIYDKVLSFGATTAQIEKLERVAKLTGRNVSSIVRELVDSAIPDVDPDSRFWSACRNSGIFNINAPAETVIAFIASFLGLPLTGNDEIDNIKIKANAPNGISPVLWALKRIEEEFYEKGLSVGSDKQSQRKDDPKEQGGAPSDKS